MTTNWRKRYCRYQIQQRAQNGVPYSVLVRNHERKKDDDVSDSREFANVVEAAPVVTVEITVVDSNKFVKKKGEKVRRQKGPKFSKAIQIEAEDDYEYSEDDSDHVVLQLRNELSRYLFRS
ncbi:hypothetical protein Tco_0127253 [Tanacetum coccineum]